MSGIFLKLRSTFYINLLKFLSFNIPMKRDSILDPSAYGFGNALAIRRRRALGSRLKASGYFCTGHPNTRTNYIEYSQSSHKPPCWKSLQVVVLTRAVHLRE